MVMGSGVSTLTKEQAEEARTAYREAEALIASSADALEESICAGVKAGLPKVPLFKQALARLVKLGTSSLHLDARVMNEALNDEIIPVHEPPDLTKLAPALRYFSVLADDEGVKAATESARDAEAAIIESPEGLDEAAEDNLREAHTRLKSSYDAAIKERVEETDLFQKAAEAVVAGGDAFGQIYSSVWTLVDKPNVSEKDDKEGEGVLLYKEAVDECLTHELLHPSKPLADLQGMTDTTDAVEYMQNAAHVRVPFGEMVTSVVTHTEESCGFKVISCKKPKALKKLSRIVEKVALRHEQDNNIASVCDCVRMMVPVKKMAHVGHLLRAFCNKDSVQGFAQMLEVDSFEMVRVKERFFASPSAGGWRDLMVNFLIVFRGKRQVCELQIVHETMLSARAGLPGHAIYNRVRNASELIEYKMGSAIAADALRLAALRVATGDESRDASNFPERLDKMVFDSTKLRPGFDSDSGKLVSIELVETQIPDVALSVLLSALRDGVWRSLASLPLIKHMMSNEDVSHVIKSGVVDERHLNLCGIGDVIDLSNGGLTMADVRLVAASVRAGAAINVLKYAADCHTPRQPLLHC